MKRILKSLNQTKWLLLVTGLFLTACSSTSNPPSAPGVKIPLQTRQASLAKIHRWNLNGKIGVQTARDSGSATVKWSQSGGSYNLQLMGPMGAGAMTLNGRPGRVDLTTSDGKHISSDSAEDLLAEHWGYKLPVSYLNYWVRGLPVPDLPAKTHYDQYNRLTGLQQSGWNVVYSGYSKTNGGDLPNAMTITSSSLRVKIVINSWAVS